MVVMVVMMVVIIVVVEDNTILVDIAKLLALILACERAQEGYDVCNLSVAKLRIALVECHIANSLVHSQARAIVVVGPSKFDITQARNLETVAVTLILSLLVAAVILLGKLRATLLEVVTAQTHKLVGVATKVDAHVARSTAISLEELVATHLLCRKGGVVTTKPLVKL